MELRPIRADEVSVIRDLRQTCFDHDGVQQVLEVEELAEDLDDDHIVLATDTRVVEADGAVVGAAWTYHVPSDVKEEKCYIFGCVDPAHRRGGIGEALMRWGIERATEQLRSSGNDLPKYVRVDEYDFIGDAHRLYARVGFEPVRYNDELLRPLTDLPPIREVDGVSIVPWPEGRDEEIRVMKNSAFLDHWGSTPTSPDQWHRAVRGFAARVDLSFIALDADDNVIAHCHNERYEADDEHIGRKDGWLANIGTLAAWRGKGIASALIIRSLHAFADAGLSHASIGVDSENPTGAARLYRNLGFTPQLRTITHQIQLP